MGIVKKILRASELAFPFFLYLSGKVFRLLVFLIPSVILFAGYRIWLHTKARQIEETTNEQTRDYFLKGRVKPFSEFLVW